MPEPLTVSAIIAYLAGELLNEVVSRAIKRTVDKAEAKALGLANLVLGKESLDAYQQALANAIDRYAGSSGTRAITAEALLRKDGPLNESIVRQELAYLLKFEREPDYEQIGRVWKRHVPEAPAWRDFTVEARLFVDFLSDELRATSVFRPVFDSKSLQAIETGAQRTAAGIETVSAQLEELRALLGSRLGEMLRAFEVSTPQISEHIRDFMPFINEKVQNFTGRQFVIDKVDAFLSSNPRGYFILKGDPGIGKSALAAHLVKTRGYFHHFNIRADGISKSEVFLTNICAQLIAYYKLDYAVLPPNAGQDSGFLVRLLNEISAQAAPAEKTIVLVDALDEVDDQDMAAGSNVLYLPKILPAGVYILATCRRTDIRLTMECEHEYFEIRQDSEQNISDIRGYVEKRSQQAALQKYIQAQNLDAPSFVEQLVEKSQGNFMYLRHVLPEIEAGAYQELRLSRIPAGLVNYYEDHWRRMRGQNEEAWIAYKLPVIVALTIVTHPVSFDSIADFSGVRERSRIRAVLAEWKEFLFETSVLNGKDVEKRWRMYHDTFREFIFAKDEVAGEYVDLKKAHSRIGDQLWQGLMGDGQSQ